LTTEYRKRKAKKKLSILTQAGTQAGKEKMKEGGYKVKLLIIS
jgi:hypothetical protein